jgi:putative membrane protein
MWHGYYAMGGGLWRFVVAVVFGTAFFGGAIALIAWAIHHAAGRHHDDQPPSNKTPLDILKERYAKGEIGKEEYDRIRRDLLN